jgi:hypothetical protein
MGLDERLEWFKLVETSEIFARLSWIKEASKMGVAGHAKPN